MNNTKGNVAYQLMCQLPIILKGPSFGLKTHMISIITYVTFLRIDLNFRQM